MTRRRDAQDRARRFPIYFIAISVVFHFLAFVILPKVKLPEPEATEETIVEIDPALLEKLEEEVQRQIVLTEKSQNRETPKDSKYLGETNQTVEKETKAKRIDTFQQGAAPRPAPRPKLSLKDLTPMKPQTQPMEKGDYEMAQRRPMTEEQDRSGAAPATNDYLKDVTEGDRTLLNTREFVYFGYYYRIRQRLEQSWNTRLRSVLMTYMRSGRKLATDKNYITRLVVVLDRHGKIKAVKILEESGARDLDDAAIEAFNRAGPFPNPPKGLIEKDGLIKIRWDFILQSGRVDYEKRAASIA